MAREVKWAVDEACSKQQLVKISVPEEVEKDLLARSKSGSIKMFFASLAFMAVVLGIVIALAVFAQLVIISVKGIGLVLLSVIFPFYAIYNIIATFGAVKKGDYDFFAGRIITKTDKGYVVNGLEDRTLNFMTKEPEGLKTNDGVIVVRVRDDLDLVDQNYIQGR